MKVPYWVLDFKDMPYIMLASLIAIDLFLFPRIWQHWPRSTSGRPPVRIWRAAREASSCKPGHLYNANTATQPSFLTHLISHHAAGLDALTATNRIHHTSRGFIHLTSCLTFLLTILIDTELIDRCPKMTHWCTLYGSVL